VTAFAGAADERVSARLWIRGRLLDRGWMVPEPTGGRRTDVRSPSPAHSPLEQRNRGRDRFAVNAEVRVSGSEAEGRRALTARRPDLFLKL